MISGDHTVLGELFQRLEATTACVDGKTCLGKCVNHQVLLDSRLADARKNLGIVAGACGHLADVEWARLQLVERDHPDVGTAVRRGRSNGFGLF